MAAKKAYLVIEDYEGEGVIVYAEKAVVARRHGADELCVDFGNVEICCRVPWADEYFPHGPPASAWIENEGWQLCACGCEKRCEEGSLQDGDGDEPDHVFIGQSVYWNAEHAKADGKEIPGGHD